VTGDSESSEQQRSLSLRDRAKDIEAIRNLSRMLRDRELPDVELSTPSSVWVSLQAHVSGLAVVYFLPGEKDGAAWVDERPTLDAAQHQGYIKRYDAFRALGVTVISISSQPVVDLARISNALGATHLMLSDPELLVGEALDLPTVDDAEQRRYRRIALIAEDGRIRGVLPTQDIDAAASARQALTWLAATHGEHRGHDGVG
jgi:peroxiredoxin